VYICGHHFAIIMDTLLIITGIILLIAGLAGALLPVLPGPPLSYLALVALHFTSREPFTTDFLLLWGVAAATVTVLDYWVPVYGTKKFGGTRRGATGSAIGLVIGLLFMGPFGVIIGPFLGAYLGEITGGSDSRIALRSAIGSFLGFIAGTVMKLVFSIAMIVLFIRSFL